MYITIGNINKSTRRKPSENAVILLGYLPVTKLDGVPPSERSNRQHELFHTCMNALLEPLIKAGSEGVEMLCPDGEVRLIFPILAAYLADHPEQCLIAPCKENRCPKCLVSRLDLGKPDLSQLRDPKETIEILQLTTLKLDDKKQFTTHGLRPIDPFWKRLPHCNIFSSFTPDLLHQLHKGVFGDHVSEWSQKLMSTPKDEADLRFKAMTTHPSLRYFKKGISLVSQWTGREYKELEKVFLGVLVGAAEARVVSAVKSTLDFIYYAHFEHHTDSSLQKLHEAWESFHERKAVFVDREIREHFRIPKLHSMQHYVHMIKSHGTTDGYNTELPERLHIDIAKDTFGHTNKKEYISQMRLRLQRLEAIRKFTDYLQWAVKGYVPSGVKQSAGGRDNEGDRSDHNEEEVSDLDDEDVDHPTVPTSLQYRVAKKPPLSLSLMAIESEIGARHFAEALERFLHGAGVSRPSLGAEIRCAKYPAFKQFTVVIPSPPQATSEPFISDVIHTRGQPRTTVLVNRELERTDKDRFRWWDIDRERIRTRLTMKRLKPFTGLQAARVRVVFKLPEGLGSYPTPLAYVEWFRGFTVEDPTVSMYKITWSTRNGGQVNAAIIPIDRIARSCHLIPVFGDEIDPSWNQDNIYKKCSDFFLNPYLRHLDFFLLRYLPTQKTRPPRQRGQGTR